MGEQQADLDAIVAAVGGGGLISGIATYVKAVNPRIKVIGAEPERAKSAFMSKQAGSHVKNPPNTPINTFAIVMENVDDVLLANEQEIEDAVRFTMERAK